MNKLLQKIKGLIEHEKSARAIGSEQEANAFAARIQELISKYQLDINEVLTTGEEEKVNGYILKFKAENWHLVLLSGIAKANSCEVMVGKPVGYPAIAGYKSDVDIVVSLFEYFSRLAVELSEKQITQSPTYYGSLSAGISFSFSYSGPTWDADDKLSKDSFLLGFATSVAQRFAEQKEQCEEEEAEIHPESQALVLLNNKTEEVMNWVRERCVMEEVENPVQTVDRFAFSRGLQQGGNIALTDKTIDKESK
jgi:hypothetical protein